MFKYDPITTATIVIVLLVVSSILYDKWYSLKVFKSLFIGKRVSCVVNGYWVKGSVIEFDHKRATIALDNLYPTVRGLSDIYID